MFKEKKRVKIKIVKVSRIFRKDGNEKQLEKVYTKVSIEKEDNI